MLSFFNEIKFKINEYNVIHKVHLDLLLFNKIPITLPPITSLDSWEDKNAINGWQVVLEGDTHTDHPRTRKNVKLNFEELTVALLSPSSCFLISISNLGRRAKKKV